MRNVLAAVVTVLAAAHGAAALAGGEIVFPVFHISKSDSRNEVHYRGVVGPDCRFAEDPIRVTWLDPTAPPRALTWLEEQLVYGVRVKELRGERVTFTVAADDTRPVTVEAMRSATGCRVRARIRILGEWAEPSYAFVDIVGESVIPEVSHVDLYARRHDGAAACERVVALRAPGVACPRPR
jgi:hypothetical protein